MDLINSPDEVERINLIVNHRFYRKLEKGEFPGGKSTSLKNAHEFKHAAKCESINVRMREN